MTDEQLGIVEMPSSTRKFAVGNDLVLLSEFELSFNKLFEAKIYTGNEIKYCTSFSNSMLRFAATWAAKEAVYKAVKQIDARPLSLKKIEIKRNEIGGIPIVVLHSHFDSSYSISLSITHDGAYAWAVAIVEIDKEQVRIH
ncbi:4'-phosphopantetheinyl transferase superfamily protein [Pedobacter sp. LMG 31464]|uniref:Holo-[acyl-carrier-protein] synthase n=1 Tax=Pedobacter planticolens TaxID=2679964 RepID=A0A923E2R3_9SPHI|nr:holo-ACP synthase [Pedobacter planticolens]MBB2146973.1 4'-phosphopantetheinyl transferase superfamily protein [Pedobacter planticolens]